ncbi:MAG: hypothetical protein WAW85_04285 [Gordonia sp. (in: high G+C Gram-positive bacteria)]
MVDHLDDDAWVVLERATRSDPVDWPDRLAPVASKVYGDTAITLARPQE